MMVLGIVLNYSFALQGTSHGLDSWHFSCVRPCRIAFILNSIFKETAICYYSLFITQLFVEGGRPKAALVGSRSSGLRRAAEGRSWLHWLLVDACAYLPRPSFSCLLYPFHWPLLAPTHSFIYILKSDLSSSPQPYTKYIFSDRILDAFYHHPTPKRDLWIAHWKGPMESRKLS